MRGRCSLEHETVIGRPLGCRASLHRLRCAKQALCPAPPPAPPMRYVQYNVSDIFDDQFRALSCHLSDGDLFPDVTQADFLRYVGWRYGSVTVMDRFKVIPMGEQCYRPLPSISS